MTRAVTLLALAATIGLGAAGQARAQVPGPVGQIVAHRLALLLRAVPRSSPPTPTTILS